MLYWISNYLYKNYLLTPSMSDFIVYSTSYRKLEITQKNQTEEWTLLLRERHFGWDDQDFDWYYHILYKGIEQIIPLGAIPLALLIYFNAKIYSAIKLPPDIELQAEEEISSINREKRLSKVLMGVVLVFNVCHTPRIIWYIYNAYNYKSIAYCTLQNPSTSGQSLWIYVLGLIYDLFLVINSSVTTLVYGFVNEKFRFYILSFILAPYKRVVTRYIFPPRPSYI